MGTTTVDLASNFAALGLGDAWKWDKGSWWLDTGEDFDVRESAARLIALGARFVAITAMERDDNEIRLDYQWDLNGNLLSFITVTHERKMATILDLCPAVDWVERETYEYFAVDFTGRATLMPLMTRVGDEPGTNLRKEAVQ